MNSIEKLSLEEYKNLLQSMIDSERECSSDGNLKTTTMHHMDNWLKVLNKEISLKEYALLEDKLFTFNQLKELQKPGIFIQTYLRIGKDSVV